MHAALTAHRPLSMPLPGGQLPSVSWPTLSPLVDDVITAENRHVEVTLRWHGMVRSVVRLRAAARSRDAAARSRDVSSFSIGTGTDDDLCVPLPAALGTSLTLLTSTNTGDWQVRVDPALGGSLRRGDTQTALSMPGTVPLRDGDVVALDVGAHRLEIRTVARSRSVSVVPFFDALWANAAVLTLFAATAFLAATIYMPTGMDGLDDDLLTNPTRFSTLILKAPPKDNAFLKRLTPPTKAPAAPTASGAAGTKTAKAEPARAASKTKTPSNEEVVAGRMAALFGESGVGSVFDGDTDGGALATALGGLEGKRAASMHGLGGLGLRGSGQDSGGLGTISTGHIATRGRGTGEVDYGTGDGVGNAKEDRDITIHRGPSKVTGSLDPELIRQVVRSHAGQVRYCYESELTKTPGLAGKVVMKWIIDASGAVVTTSTAETGLDNTAVESCLASRIKTWRFPMPKGGGIVVVNYPFVFKQAG